MVQASAANQAAMLSEMASLRQQVHQLLLLQLGAGGGAAGQANQQAPSTAVSSVQGMIIIMSTFCSYSLYYVLLGFRDADPDPDSMELLFLRWLLRYVSRDSRI